MMFITITILKTILLFYYLFITIFSTNLIENNRNLIHFLKLMDLRENCGDPRGWRKNTPRSGKWGRGIF
jgi:hypothetical protein